MPEPGSPAVAYELPLWCPLDFEVNAEALTA